MNYMIHMTNFAPGTEWIFEGQNKPQIIVKPFDQYDQYDLFDHSSLLMEKQAKKGNFKTFSSTTNHEV